MDIGGQILTGFLSRIAAIGGGRNREHGFAVTTIGGRNSCGFLRGMTAGRGRTGGEVGGRNPFKTVVRVAITQEVGGRNCNDRAVKRTSGDVCMLTYVWKLV